MSSLEVHDGWDSPIEEETGVNSPWLTAAAVEVRHEWSDEKDGDQTDPPGPCLMKMVDANRTKKFRLSSEDLRKCRQLQISGKYKKVWAPRYRFLEDVEMNGKGATDQCQHQHQGEVKTPFQHSTAAKAPAPRPMSPRKRMMTKSQRNSLSLHREQDNKPKRVYATGLASRKSAPDSTPTPPLINPEPEVAEVRQDSDKNQRAFSPPSLKNVRSFSPQLMQDLVPSPAPRKDLFETGARARIPRRKDVTKEGLPVLLPVKPSQIIAVPVSDASTLCESAGAPLPPQAVKVSSDAAPIRIPVAVKSMKQTSTTRPREIFAPEIETRTLERREDVTQKLKKQASKPIVPSPEAPAPHKYAVAVVHPPPPPIDMSPLSVSSAHSHDSCVIFEAKPAHASSDTNISGESSLIKELQKKQLKERRRLEIKHSLEYAESLLAEMRAEEREAEKLQARGQNELKARFHEFEQELRDWTERIEEFEIPAVEEELADLRRRKSELISKVAAYATKKKMEAEKVDQANYLYRRFKPGRLLELLRLDEEWANSDDLEKAQLRQARWHYIEKFFHQKGEKLELWVGKAKIAYSLVPIACKFVVNGEEKPSADGNAATVTIRMGDRNAEFTMVGDEDLKKIQALATKKTKAPKTAKTHLGSERN